MCTLLLRLALVSSLLPLPSIQTASPHRDNGRPAVPAAPAASAPSSQVPAAPAAAIAPVGSGPDAPLAPTLAAGKDDALAIP